MSKEKGVNHQEQLDRQKEHFNSISSDYYNYRQKPTHLLFKKYLWNYFFSRNAHLFSNHKIKVLEAMCGYCEGKHIIEEHLTKNFTYSGFDYSEEMVKIAKKKFPNNSIFQKDITKFNEKDKYDLVIVIGGLHHVHKFAYKSLVNVADSLVSGGYLLVFEPTNNNKLIAHIREKVYKNNDFFDDDTEHDFNLGELNNMFRKNNLEIVDQVYPGLLSYTLFYNPDAFKKINVNNKFIVRLLFHLERPLFTRWLGRKFSFCTLTLVRKN